MVVVNAQKTGAELNHSRILNVNRWSGYPEVNEFVDDIYNEHFSDLTKIRKKHLKVVLLDLYVCWYWDPEMCLGVHLNKNKYKAGSINSALNISDLTILVVKRLKKDHFIYLRKGNTIFPKISRMWPTGRLIELFQKASFSILDIGLAPNTNTIVLRDKDPKYIPKNEKDKIPQIDIEYEFTSATEAMREVLMDYNDKLYKTHIDVANLTKPYIERKKGKKQKRPSKIQINQHNKFVRRIFNDGSFDRGGRFYGGFWQQIGKEHRSHIQIDGQRVIEIDFSGWHIQLLYARKNINYFTKYGTNADPYDIHVPELNDPEYKRWLVKTVILIAVNARSEKSAFRAIQHTDTPEDLIRPTGLKLSNDLLTSMLDKLKAKHSEIAEFFCSGAGIELQNVDGKITEKLIKSFTASNIPILTVHDSYLVPEQYNHDLFTEMLEAYKEIALEGQHIEADGLAGLETELAYTKVQQLGYYDEAIDYEEAGGGEEHQKIVALKDKLLIETKAYQRRLSDFQEWVQKTP